MRAEGGGNLRRFFLKARSYFDQSLTSVPVNHGESIVPTEVFIVSSATWSMDALLEDPGLNILIGEDHKVIHKDLLAVCLLVVHTHSHRVLPCITQILETLMTYRIETYARQEDFYKTEQQSR